MNPEPKSELVFATTEQDARFARAFGILEEGIRERAFPGVAVAVAHKGNLLCLKGLGRQTYDPNSPAIAADTKYDLASLTKAVATAAMAMILYNRGRLKLDAPLAELVPEFLSASNEGDQGQRERVTMRMLLTHSSGLPAYVKMFEHAYGRDAILDAACRLRLECPPGTRSLYSDPGFLLLGVALERLAGERLDAFCAREVFAPLWMSHTIFNPPEGLRSSIPPTEEDRTFRRRIIQGEVQDENAWAFGGVAGHAGLFAPALDLARFAQCMLGGGAPLVSANTVSLFTRRAGLPPDASRALGWDTPSQPSQSGNCFSPESFGHLGYAGTSLWIDPRQQVSVTLLTNRTWPDRSSQLIKKFRPRFHDAVIEALRAD